ncbi:MAG: hypothetical protein FWB95_08775 [Treponema sp.]|nr:hypothetical protein [Treponema sp.]MCL2212000.1 hypothetical protein [Treponema sp.]
MKKIVLAVLIIACFSNAVYTQDFEIDNYQFPLLFPMNTALTFNPVTPCLTVMADESEYKYPSNFFGALGCGLLNIFFGLGSFLANDWITGTIFAAWQGASVISAVILGWPDLMAGTFFDGWDKERWDNAGKGLMIGGGIGLAAGICSLFTGGGFEMFLMTPLFGIVGGVLGGIIGFCVQPDGVKYTSENMNWAMFAVGVWAFGAILSVIPPVVMYFYDNPKQNKTAQLNDLRNWDISLFPADDGRLMGHIVFTAHF